jgi:hypothetical protein
VAHVPYQYAYSAYPAGETLDRAKLIAQAQADATITTGLALVELDATSSTVTYHYVAALDQTQQDALDALVAAYEFQTLDECKAECAKACTDWRDYKMNVPEDPTHGILVEHPAASGKKWSIKAGDVVLWSALATVKDNAIWPMTRRTWDEKDSHEFSNEAAYETFYGLIRDAVLGEADACDTALANIHAATDKAGAQAAMAAYAGV